MKWTVVPVIAAALLAAGCGTRSQDRVTGGAAAGAATGAGVGALGGPVGALAGAAIGGGAGAVTGAVTEPRDLNLGRPPWSNPEVRTPVDENRPVARRTYRSRSQASRATLSERDRAYMGGGMVMDRPPTPTPPMAPSGPPPSATP